MHDFLLTFIPLFVAVDAIGVLPLFISFTDGLDREQKTRVVTQSLITAFAIGIVFLFIGKWIFRILGVSVSDFKIAGGAVLLAISLSDILRHEKTNRIPHDTVGAVPIGTPMITGPAVLTTMIILVDTHGLGPTIFSFLVNLAITWLVFTFADAITGVLGKAGSKALSKIASLLLTAIAVMMIRIGVIETILSAAKR
jgi:multiple antibiotic resistance protein